MFSFYKSCDCVAITMFLYLFFSEWKLKIKLENIEADYSGLQAASTNQIGHYSQNKFVIWIRQMKWGINWNFRLTVE